MTKTEEVQKENIRRCTEIAKIAAIQYQCLMSEGLSCEDARVITAAVISSSVMLSWKSMT